MAVSIDVLRKLPVLRWADDDTLQGLANVSVERRFEPGQVIVEEGSTGRELYIILEGAVEVVKGRGVEAMLLAIRGPGDIIGEMSFLEGRPRFATLRVQKPALLLQFSEQELTSLLLQQPRLLYQTLRVLTARLRESDLKMIADLQSKTVELAEAYRGLQEAQAAMVEKERLEHELELARQLQQSILPHQFPNLSGFHFAARSRPARQVGGDFYDAIALGPDRVGLVIADVSDKGMAAALYMALTRSLIHAEARRSSSPRRVLLNTHRLLLEMTQSFMFVTAFYGVLDARTGSLTYARAGHDLPLLVSPDRGDCRSLSADGTILGLLKDIRLEEAGVDLRSGDALVLYTDGITDATTKSGEYFGLERLRETVKAAAAGSAEELCDAIFARVNRFQRGAAQHDDMALLVVKADGGSHRPEASPSQGKTR